MQFHEPPKTKGKLVVNLVNYKLLPTSYKSYTKLFLRFSEEVSNPSAKYAIASLSTQKNILVEEKSEEDIVLKPSSFGTETGGSVFEILNPKSGSTVFEKKLPNSKIFVLVVVTSEGENVVPYSTLLQDENFESDISKKRQKVTHEDTGSIETQTWDICKSFESPTLQVCWVAPISRTKREWKRNLNDTMELSSPPFDKIVKSNTNNPFPRVKIIPYSSLEMSGNIFVTITLLGKLRGNTDGNWESYEDCLSGTKIVKVENGIADFCDIRISETSQARKLEWVFSFSCLLNGVTVTISTSPFITVSHISQLVQHNPPKLSKLTPSQVEVGAIADVALRGEFQTSIPHPRVLFGEEEKIPSVAHSDILYIENISSDVPKIVDVRVRTGALESNSLTFSFFSSQVQGDDLRPLSMEKYNKLEEEWLPIHNFAFHGDFEKLSELRASNNEYDMDQRDHFRSTPLFWACYVGHMEAVQFLLRSGADPTKSNCIGISPIVLSYYRRHTEILSLLLKHCPKVDKFETCYEDIEYSSIISIIKNFEEDSDSLNSRLKQMKIEKTKRRSRIDLGNKKTRIGKYWSV